LISRIPARASPGSGDHEINLPAAAAGAGKASKPVDDRGLGAIALRHFAGVGLDLTAAVSTPYDQPHHCRRAERRTGAAHLPRGLHRRTHATGRAGDFSRGLAQGAWPVAHDLTTFGARLRRFGRRLAFSYGGARAGEARCRARRVPSGGRAVPRQRAEAFARVRWISFAERPRQKPL
jgi:hypothetical protein